MLRRKIHPASFRASVPAEQHLINFKNWLEPLGIKVSWLAGKVKGKAREAALAEISGGEAQVVVGTHALFQDEVAFHDLAMVVIDEQHHVKW